MENKEISKGTQENKPKNTNTIYDIPKFKLRSGKSDTLANASKMFLDLPVPDSVDVRFYGFGFGKGTIVIDINKDKVYNNDYHPDNRNIRLVEPFYTVSVPDPANVVFREDGTIDNKQSGKLYVNIPTEVLVKYYYEYEAARKAAYKAQQMENAGVQVAKPEDTAEVQPSDVPVEIPSMEEDSILGEFDVKTPEEDVSFGL